MQKPICKCGALVVSLDSTGKTDTGVETFIGRCPRCRKICKFRAVFTPREQWVLCDYYEDRYTDGWLKADARAAKSADNSAQQS